MGFTAYPKKKTEKKMIEDPSSRPTEIVVVIKAEAERNRSERQSCVQTHRIAFRVGLDTGMWSRKDSEVSG